MRTITIIGQVALGAILVACQRPSPALGNTARDSAGTVGGTSDTALPDSIAPHLAFIAQWRGDRDTVRLVMDESGAVHYPTVIVSGPRHPHPLRFRTQIDGVPIFAAFGDLDSNGWRDIVLLNADESSILAQVVMVSADSLWDPPTHPADLWQRSQFTRETRDLSRACEMAVFPKIIRDSVGSEMLSVAAGSQTDGSDCGPIRHVQLVVRDGVLREAAVER